MTSNHKKLNISVIVGGRFHAFDLAKELNKNKCLDNLITTYPKFFLKKFNLNKKSISLFYIEFIKRLVKKLLNLFNKDLNDYFFNNFFDLRASKIIYKSNIIIGWSSFCKNTFEKNKDKILVLERGSSHIQFQDEILKKAYNEINIPYKQIDKRLIEKELQEYQIANYISVPSKFAKDSFLTKNISKDKLIQVPLGVNLNDFYKFKKKEKNNNLRIIYVGQLSVRKGIIYLLEAFDQLSNNKNYKNIELICIGEIHFELKKKLSYFRKNKKIYFLGPKTQKDLIKYYNSCDIFILPSIEEGLAMVQLQSLACGVPVISTKNSGAEDIINDGSNGFIIEPFNIEEIKNKIIFFQDNKNLISKFSEASIAQSKNFSWEIYTKKLISIYEKILIEKNQIFKK